MNDKDCRPPPRGGVRYFVTRLLAKAIGFVGDYRSRDTPDPIPNSEVKSWPPMILLSGKVGYCRLFQPRNRKVAGLSFWYINYICTNISNLLHFSSLSCSNTNSNTLDRSGSDLSTATFTIGEVQFKKTKSLEGDGYLVGGLKDSHFYYI